MPPMPALEVVEVVEVQHASAVGIARHSQVAGAADVGAELEGVVAPQLRPVGDTLVLVFVFNEWAVAAANVETFSKIRERCGIGVHLERRKARGEGCRQGSLVGDVEARNSQVAHRSRTCEELLSLGIVVHPPKAEVSQPSLTERLRHSDRHAVIVNV